MGRHPGERGRGGAVLPLRAGAEGGGGRVRAAAPARVRRDGGRRGHQRQRHGQRRWRQPGRGRQGLDRQGLLGQLLQPAQRVQDERAEDGEDRPALLLLRNGDEGERGEARARHGLLQVRGVRNREQRGRAAVQVHLPYQLLQPHLRKQDRFHPSQRVLQVRGLAEAEGPGEPGRGSTGLHAEVHRRGGQERQRREGEGGR
mmetsp:Transcript_13758/g.38786  ORF Transcript_13758/g.38786 Transcript_13758/m.38786 type:complete len:201 (+) Transcript_13758:591-1193(+)